MEHRLTLLRQEVDKLIYQCNPAEIRHFFQHLYGVSKFCALLALKRNVNPELAATSGLLHDIYQVTDKSTVNHAEKGAVVAEFILKTVGGYSNDEIIAIKTAISRHSDKNIVQEPLDEVLKDADMIDHNLNSNNVLIANRELERYNTVLVELGCLASAK